MRCKACDSNLNNSESVRKSLRTGEFLDLCDPCVDSIKEFLVLDEQEVDNDKDFTE